MASQFQILGSVLTLVKAALDGLSPAVSYKAAIGYPPVNALQGIAKGTPAGQPALVSIYDRKISRNSTRWSPYVFAQEVVPATLTTAIAPERIAPGATAQITLGGTLTAGDSVSALAIAVGAGTGAVVVTGTEDDTPTTMATALAAAINSNPSLSGLLTATASGPVVTVTNVAQVALAVGSYAGNGGSQQREIGRRDQQVQVILWAQTVEQRNAMVEALAEAIAESELNFGPSLPDGSTARLSYVSDYDLEDDTLEDVYRHDFMVGLDYPVTVTDALFAVLAPVATMRVQLQVG
jgi:hypothetical protein